MTARFIPARSLEGGTPVGSSYMSAWVRCPYFFFNNYVRPVSELETGERLVGIQPRFRARALSLGSMNHSFLEHLYLSGCVDGEDTGEWDFDQAMNGLEVTKAEVKSGYQNEDDWQADAEMAEQLGRYYVDRYGLRGTHPDWPRFKTAFDSEGMPLIERQFELEVGVNDPEGNPYIITSKPDIIMYDNGYLITRDHKTAAKGWGQRRAANIDTDPQFTMEHMILMELFPEESFQASEVNIIVKGLVAHSKAERFFRNTTTRTLTDIAVFKSDTIDILTRIDEAVGAFRVLWDTTGDLEHAASLAFPRHGVRTDACHAFNRQCDFYDFCVRKDNMANNLLSFKPRRVERVEG